MNRTPQLKRVFRHALGAVMMAVLTLTQVACISRPAPRPNILFIMTDDHAAHAIGCYGSRINATPQLDRLAAEGMRFANCFCTNSICAPSRAAILTGKYSHRNGIIANGRAFDGSQVTFPKLLRQAGYQTALIGKWHLKSDPTGFDYWSVLPGQGKYINPDMDEMGTRQKNEGYATDLVTDKAIAWLKERSTDKPFLLMCQHKAPHRPWVPDAKHADMYNDIEIPEPPTFNDDYAGRSDAARDQAMSIEHDLSKTDVKGTPPEGLTGEALKKWKYQRYIKDYLRCVASVDDNIGRMLDYLEESGLAKDTVVVYTSDQGFFLGDHGWYDKRFMYEEALRMPLIVRYPREIDAGSVTDDVVTNVDFAATFLDLAGVDIPAAMQGESMRPILRGQAPKDWRQSMYYRYYEYGHLGKGGWHKVRPHYGIRTQRYKLIYFDDLDAWEFYDLQQDPLETHNRYDDPACAAVVAELKAELGDLQKHYDDAPELTRDVLEAQWKAEGR